MDLAMIYLVIFVASGLLRATALALAAAKGCPPGIPDPRDVPTPWEIVLPAWILAGAALAALK